MCLKGAYLWGFNFGFEFIDLNKTIVIASGYFVIVEVGIDAVVGGGLLSPELDELIELHVLINKSIK